MSRSRLRAPESYDIHGVLRLRTDARIVPEIPRDFRVTSVTPDLEILQVEAMDRPPMEGVRASLGHPRTCDLGGGEVFYELPMPLLAYLGVSMGWRLRVRGLADRETRITTAMPLIRFKPVEARITELLSRISYMVLGLKLWSKGYALCHASAVARGDDAYLFFGYIGSGKTTVSLALLDSACDASLSDDSTLIDGGGRAYAWPEYHPAHSGGQGLPALRYVRRNQHATYTPKFPVRKSAKARAVLFLEEGPDAIMEIDREEATRRALLVNADEISRFWNSPAAQILNQYSYFYPELDLGRRLLDHASILGSFMDHVNSFYVVRSSSPTYDAVRDLVAGTG